jgi:predicted membrane-bound spermidine synthase
MDSIVLPPVQIPLPPQSLYRMRVTVVDDDTTLTVKTGGHDYTFYVAVKRDRPNDNLFKLFFTQLMFDAIIHLKDNLFVVLN